MYRPHCYVPIQAHRANTPQDAEMVLITALLRVTASASEKMTGGAPEVRSDNSLILLTFGN